MNVNHPLDFERDLVNLEQELENLRQKIGEGKIELKPAYDKLEVRIQKNKSEIYGRLNSYQRVQLSRHFDRPFCLDFITMLFTDFIELHGDRLFRDDPAIIGGTAQFNGEPIMVIGHQRGRSTAERIERNFGMSQPEGYRKSQRLLAMAEKFQLPVITFIDTQGAYPGVEAEERGQAEAIARSLLILSQLKVPTISVVIGEGGSGGALALGLTDRILMLENACYSVITPEGCASILWKDEQSETVSEKVALAADALQLTATHLKRHGVIDQIVAEPLGGAHRNWTETADNLAVALVTVLTELKVLTVEELVQSRYEKFRSIGYFT
jgi:acetyl-CoA carboxylase carboxyl transferase subunit alpha